MLKNGFCGLLLYVTTSAFGQYQSIDVQHMTVDLQVNDSTDNIVVKETINFSWIDTNQVLHFDLAALNGNGKGMNVSSITNGNISVDFRQEKEKIVFPMFKAMGKSNFTFTFYYQGVPINGLIIGKNKFGSRTFFGDNWPNRAHNWLVCNDHPSDKTTIDFTVRAPKKYSVIANGEFVAKNEVNNKEVEYRYHSGVLLPMKVIVVGIAEFSIKELNTYTKFPLSSWVYPENEADGFKDFDLAPEILDFFINYVGNYEYEKLANVQSTTQFGGMENAGCIFYDENAITGKQTMESLMVHEIAHQWFGNSASEKDWKDVWLSEGIVTYLTNLYILNKYGEGAFIEQLENDRIKVIKFSKVYKHPVVDTNYSDLMSLLNPNSYQKGGLILHMLRKKIGDEVFQKGIKMYYQRYRLSNASTSDFQHVFEEVSGLKLDSFFQQWLYVTGHPILDINVEHKAKKAQVTLNQLQENAVFSFPLTIEFTLKRGGKIYKEIEVSSKTTQFEMTFPSDLVSWKVDPFCDVLIENHVKH